VKTIVAISLLSLCLAACKEHSASSPSVAAELKPEIVAVAPVAVSDIENTEDTEVFTFAFTTTDEVKAEADARFAGWEDSPCGPSPLMKLSDMPLQDEVVIPDFVIEFDNAGKEINRWGKPYNSSIIDLKADHISFTGLNTNGEIVTYSTDSHGNIKRLTDNSTDTSKSNISNGKSIQCPVLEDPFGKDSAYLQCIEVIDPSNNKTRKIAFESACT
jgi:hypothetical protein